jgi:hypothetical protein
MAPNVRIGHGVPSEPKSIPDVALLSAALATGDANVAVPEITNSTLGGQSLLEHQIGQLGRLGVSRFLVEVDHVTGALLHLADSNSKNGRSVEFVRSGSDIQRLLHPSDRLLVQSEAVYVAPDLLKQMLNQAGAFIVSLDGRDENEAFERIDLNTRWAGIALVEAQTVVSLQNLPEGWSMTSSILRQALQDKVGFYALNQQYIQDGKLRLVRSAQDFSTLNCQILVGRIDQSSGFLETRILAPIAARIAPSVWGTSAGPALVSGASIISAASSLGLGATGFIPAAIVSAMIAIMLNILGATIADRNSTILSRFAPMAVWALLGLSTLATARLDMSYSSDGIFAALTVLGLAVLAQKLVLPAWARQVLKSPALITILMLIASPVVGFIQALQWIGIAQLAAMIASLWTAKDR